MRSARALLGLLPVCGLLLACDGTGPNSPAELMGDWGGAGAELTVGADTTTLQLACLTGGLAEIPQLVDGRFQVAGELHSLNSHFDVTVRGRLIPGLSLERTQFLELEITYPGTPGFEEEYLLVRGADGDFGNPVCLQ